MKYSTAILLVSLLFYSCRNETSGIEIKRNYNSLEDSLSGTYVETMSIKGVTASTKYFQDHKLVVVETFTDGYLTDRMTVDSLGNPKRHFPLLLWINAGRINNLDTLKFEIRNVYPLTFYQYFYATSLMKLEREGKTIQEQRPININDEPLIKIPVDQVRGSDTLYLKCGILVNVIKIDTTEEHQWGYFMNKFHLK